MRFQSQFTARLGMTVVATVTMSGPVLAGPTGATSSVTSGQNQVVQLALGHQLFVPNGGQWSDLAVRYGLRARNWSVALRNGGEIELTLRKAKAEVAGPLAEGADDDCDAVDPMHRDRQAEQKFDETAVRISFVGCHADAKPVGIDATQTKVNYFVGGADRKNAAGLASYSSIEYPDLYDGIDLYVKGNESDGSLKYEFHVSPGADPAQIRIHYNDDDESIESMCIDHDASDTGDLLINIHGVGTIRDKAPVVWYANSASDIVTAHYELVDGNTCRIVLDGPVDSSRELIIDPSIVWMDYLGGTDGEVGDGVAIDASNNSYIVGATRSTDFTGHINDHHGGGFDTFVAKVNSSGSLMWMTYLGGSGIDQGAGIALDSQSNILVTGSTDSVDFEGHINSLLGGFDEFAVKLNNSGALQWMTYLGGSGNEEPLNVVVNRTDDDVYTTGQTDSTDFVGRLNSHSGNKDAYAVKVSAAGAVQWMTYLGGSGDDAGLGIGIDSLGNLLISGNSDSPEFPGHINSPIGAEDAMAVKVSPAGSVLWMRYLGGSDDDESFGIVADSNDNVLISGLTRSSDFRGRTNSLHGETDAIAVKLSSNGALLWMTYIGGDAYDEGDRNAVDQNGNLYSAGLAASTNIEGRVNSYPGGSRSGILYKVNAAGALQYVMYLGGSGQDACLDVALDHNDHAIVTGGTTSTNFPGRLNAYKGGTIDAIAIQVDVANSIQLSVTASCPSGGPIQITWSGATSGGTIALIFARNTGTFHIPTGNPCAGTQLGLGSNQIQLAYQGSAGANGSRTLNANAGPGACGGYMQLLDVPTCATSNVVNLH